MDKRLTRSGLQATAINFRQNIAAEVRQQFPEFPIPSLVEALQAMHQSEARIVPIKEAIPAFPPEGAVAWARALKRVFGWVDTQGATMMSVEVGVRKVERVPWGPVTIPGFSGILRTEIVWERGVPKFCLGGEARQREMPKVEELGKLIRQEVEAGSIYKGKAVRFDLPKILDESQREHMSVEDFCPTFLPLDESLTKDVLVLPKLVAAGVEELVFAPVERTQAFREHNIPLRNGIILFGPPGCGKTLIAAILANLCVRHKWTYVEVTDVKQLADAYRFAAARAPAVLATEDIDRLMDDDPDTITAIRNTLDGVDTKSAEVQVVFTSNYAERLPDVLIRSGRLGGHIQVPPPDADAAQKLLRNYAGKYLAEVESLDMAGEVLAGRVPAMLRDVVERGKRRAIIADRWNGDDEPQLTGEELHLTAQLATGEFDSLQPIPEDKRHPLERGLDHVAEAFSKDK